MAGRLLCLVLVLALTGCDQVFNLTFEEGCAVDSHDEDGDGVTDGCDNCPAIENPGQENDLETLNGEGADAVGDACDPAPTKPGDRIERFTTFASSSEPTKWRPAGMWTFAEDSVKYQRGIDSDDLVDLVEQPAPPFTIETGVTINVYPDRYEVLIEANVDNTLGRRVTCGLIRYAGGEQFVHLESEDGDLVSPVENDSDDRYPTSPLMEGVRYRYRLLMTYLDAANVRCEAIGDQGRTFVDAVAPSLPLSGPPAMGLGTKLLDAEFDYRIIYTRD